MAIKNDVGVFYFATVVPLNIYFDESGQMDKRDFLQMWKEIPEQNEVQFVINNVKGLSAGLLILLLFINYVRNDRYRHWMHSADTKDVTF